MVVDDSTASALIQCCTLHPDCARGGAEKVLGALQRSAGAGIPDQFSFVTVPWTAPPRSVTVRVPLVDCAESDTDPCRASSRG